MMKCRYIIATEFVNSLFRQDLVSLLEKLMDQEQLVIYSNKVCFCSLAAFFLQGKNNFRGYKICKNSLQIGSYIEVMYEKAMHTVQISSIIDKQPLHLS